MKPILRFAPSPTGRLHIGNVRTATLNWLYAAKHAGTFILRLDDTDIERSTEEFAQGIRDDLTWLGLTWAREERQSLRTDRYEAAAAQLKAAGLLYPCFETEDELDRRRNRQRALGRPPIYDRAALKLSRRGAGQARSRRAQAALALPPAQHERGARAHPAADDHLVERSHPRRSDGRSGLALRSRADPRRRHVSLHLHERGRRHRVRRHAHHPRRGSRHQHRRADRDPGSAGRGAAGVRTSLAADRRGRAGAVQAAWARCRCRASAMRAWSPWPC